MIQPFWWIVRSQLSLSTTLGVSTYIKAFPESFHSLLKVLIIQSIKTFCRIERILSHQIRFTLRLLLFPGHRRWLLVAIVSHWSTWRWLSHSSTFGLIRVSSIVFRITRQIRLLLWIRYRWLVSSLVLRETRFSSCIVILLSFRGTRLLLGGVLWFRSLRFLITWLLLVLFLALGFLIFTFFPYLRLHDVIN